MEVNSLKIAIDTKDAITASKNLNQLDTSVKKVDNTTKGALNTFNTSSTSLAGMATRVAGATAVLYALQRALTFTVSSGFAFNKAMEESKAGLIALSVAVQDKAIPVTERFARANKEAAKTLAQLQKINAQTPHTLDQTNKIYKAMYVSMKNVGASSEQMIELTRSLSIASGAAGIEFNSLLAGVDGLASGTVLANSDLGRFLSSLGLTNEALKESKDVVGLVTEALKDFKAAGTMAEALSNLENAWDSLAGTLTEDIFEDAKDSANSFSSVLNKLNERLVDYKANIEDISDIHKITNTKVLMRELEQLGQEYVKLIDGGVGLLQSQGNYNAEVQKYEFLIKSTIQKLGRLNEEEARSVEVKKTSVELTKEQIRELEKQIALNERLYNSYVNITGSEYDKWLNDTNNTMIELAKSTELTAEQLQKAFDALSIDAPLTDLEQSIADAFETMNEPIDIRFNIHDKDLKKLEKYDGIGSKDWTAGLKGQAKDIANIGNAFADLGKEQKEWAKYSADNAVTEEDKAKHLDSQLGLYGNIAGAIGNMASEGSAAAKVAQAAQAALAITQGASAILNAGTFDPYTAIPRMIAMAATVAGVLGNAGISGGGGGISASYTQAVSDANYKAEESNALLEELERHTELLETLANTEGTVAKYQTQAAGLGLTVDLEELYASIIEQSEEMYTALNIHARAFEITGDRVEDIPNILEWLQGGSINEAGWNWLRTNRSDVLEWQSTFEEAVHDYGMGIADVSESVSDASQTFRDIYDELSGLSTYAKKDLQEAFTLLEGAFGGSNVDSLLNYLAQTIENIENIGDEYADTVRETLLTGTEQEKIMALEELSLQFGVTFENGVEDALNYLDAIELVSEAMIDSRENITSFVDSFLTEQQSADRLATSLGVNLATSMDDLVTLSAHLYMNNGLLEDSELELLEANKALIESGLDEYINTVTNNISTLEGIVNSLSNVIDRLRGEAIGAEYSLEQYYTSMSEALALSDGDDYEAFATAVQDAISKSGALSNSSLFSTSRDMQFAQLVAANQFESMETTTLTQIDYLRLIAENTESTSEGMLDSVAELIRVADELRNLNYNMTERWIYDAGTNSNTWTSTGGATASYSSGDTDYAVTGTGGGTMSGSEVASWVIGTIESGNPVDVYRKAVEEGISANTLDAIMMSQGVEGWYAGLSNEWASASDDPTIVPFANGGIVTSPTMGLIGEAGYSEAVIPLKDPNDPLGQKALIEEIRMLRSEVTNLRTDNNYYSERIDNNTKPDYFAVS